MKAAADSSLVRLLQLASPTLPVGAYSYSQGIEAAVEARIVRDAAGAQRWIADALGCSVARMEAPLLFRLCDAWTRNDLPAIGRWNALFLATRETAELRAETVQMGYSLRMLLAELGVGEIRLAEVAFPTAFACAVVRWGIAPRSALVAYLWAWLENQVMAALKAVPLGQTEAQKMLLALGSRLDAVAAQAAALSDDELDNFAPGLALLSSRHETQYSRLFRS
jgi:urease accessory protein